jgi:hypothetical protein
MTNVKVENEHELVPQPHFLRRISHPRGNATYASHAAEPRIIARLPLGTVTTAEKSVGSSAELPDVGAATTAIA